MPCPCGGVKCRQPKRAEKARAQRGEAVQPCEGVAAAGCLRLRGLEQVAIHVCLSFTAMLAVALAAFAHSRKISK